MEPLSEFGLRKKIILCLRCTKPLTDHELSSQHEINAFYLFILFIYLVSYLFKMNL
jgi:hypothetical protein